MRTTCLAMTLLVLSSVVASAAEPLETDPLVTAFHQPPQIARPLTWWHWMNGNVTREGITADLESMKRVGIGGAHLFNVDGGIPRGGVELMSPQWLDLVQHSAKEAERLGLEFGIHNCPGWSSSGGPWNTPDHAMQVVVTSEQQVAGPMRFDAVLATPMTKIGHYRDIVILAFPEPPAKARVGLNNFRGKAFYDRSGDYRPDDDLKVPADELLHRETFVDLSVQTTADGRLTWDVPAGNWTILRVGYAPNGRTNHPTPFGGEGLECDKLSASAVDAHWAGMMQPVIDKLGPLNGKVLNHVVLDSYEVGTQNWTPLFRQEFVARRGYDPVTFLPVFAGRIVDGPEVTERFLWDVRRTVADLFAEKYAGRLAELAHKNGLTLSIEPYGNSPSDDLQYGAIADVPMTEFWIVKELDNCTRLAASIAHTNGKRIVGSESFTAGELGGNAWNTDPFALKAVGDLIFSAGANRFSFHCYTHQPWLDRAPGMTMGACGTHFGRTNTWWELAGPWVQYLTRCQAMLQQGLNVADVLYYAGEDVPGPMYGDGAQMPNQPKGYESDGCSADVLMNRVTVKDGRLVLPDGMSYRMLVLPKRPTMRPAILRKLKELADAGAIIVGPKPTKAPGLSDYPNCDAEVMRLVKELWRADLPPTGGGIVDKSPAEVLAALKLKPDFEFAGDDARLVFNHRVVDGTDIYFVSNQRPTDQQTSLTFRMSGKVPELWHPKTGLIERAPVYSETDGRVTVPMRFAPAESVFVVFRTASDVPHIVSTQTTADDGDAVRQPGELRILKAEFCNLEKPEKGRIDVTQTVAKLVRDGQLIVRIEDTLAPKDHGITGIKGLIVEYEYDGHRNTARAMQQRVMELPAAVDLQFPPPPFELSTADDRSTLRGWRDGAFAFQTSDGKTVQAQVSGVSAPVEIAGPWTVQFPPNLGAPVQATFDRLISWTEHPDDGIKYFSGTATYVKEFDVSADRVSGEGKQLHLDLGRLQNVAQVVVNGTDLGIFWRPPYRVDVTRVVKPGKNHLEVRITNLWPNRLIGDERLPDDKRWSGERMKAWPQWLTDGKPAPTGRLTFATRKHWTKDDQPLPSGLFGPVVLRQSQTIAIESGR